MPATQTLEAEILLLCARTRLLPLQAERLVRLLDGPVNWHQLLAMAQMHLSDGFLYWNLNRHCPQAVPTQVMEPLRERFQRITRRNLAQMAALLRVVDECARINVPVLPYKGPMLGALVYQNLGLRRFTDLDLFIRPADISRLEAVLPGLGYSPEPRLTAHQAAAARQYKPESNWVQPGPDPVILDIHWRILPAEDCPGPASRAYESELWNRLRQREQAGRLVRILPPEDLILILCLHNSKNCHHWRRLDWICDLAEMLAHQEELDWDWIMWQAARLHGERRLWLGLWLARELFISPLPTAMIASIEKDQVVSRLGEELIQLLFNERVDPRQPIEKIDFSLQIRSNLLERIAFLIHRALTPTPEDWLCFDWPKPALYIASRPFRLMSKHLSRIQTKIAA